MAQQASLRDYKKAALHAGLRYVNPGEPGITRLKSGKGLKFVGATGKAVTDKATLARIAGMVIPPAYTDVWICRDAKGHLQAVGIDALGRKQPRYHARWREVRDEAKFEHVIDFAHLLPKIRATARRHVRAEGLAKQKVLAALVLVMEKTLCRVGNDQSANQFEHYGLTTLEDRHATYKGNRVTFAFVGKSGKSHDVGLTDKRLASIVKQCADLPGQQLFQYLDTKGKVHDVKSSDVNAYLKEITGREITAKDFRTWAATVLTAKALVELAAASSATQAKKNIVAVIEDVSKRLGNTRSVCRKCYIHPAILDSYLDGSTIEVMEKEAARISHTKLSGTEAAVVKLLKSAMKQKTKAA